MAECVVKNEENIRRLHVRHGKILFVQEMERVTKCVLSDQVTCESPEDIVQGQNFTSLPGCFQPAEKLCQVVLNNGLQSANTSSGEETANRVPPPTMHVMVDCCNNGLRSYDKNGQDAVVDTKLTVRIGVSLLPVRLPVKKYLLVFLPGPGKMESMNSGSLKWTSWGLIRTIGPAVKI